MEKPKLFTVGPTYVDNEVLAAMSHQMFSHRSPDYVKLQGELIAKLKEFMGLEDTGYEVFIFTSSSTGIMEASVRNCISAGGSMLNMSCGAFGERFSEIVVENGRNSILVDAEWGSANTPSQVERALLENDDDNKNNNIEAVAITHCETSTGVLNPLEKICKVTGESDALTIVDCVSSMSATDIRIADWGIDVCFFGVQKCLGVPPGLAIAAVSEDAVEKAKTVTNRGHYFDFLNLKKYNDKNMIPYTPPIPQMFALVKSLDMIFEEGKENRFKRYIEVSGRVRQGCKSMGFGIFPDENYLTPTLSCISIPGNFNLPAMQSMMKERGFVLASGYGKIKDSTFRVGSMGNVYLEDVNEMLDALGEVVEDLKD